MNKIVWVGLVNLTLATSIVYASDMECNDLTISISNLTQNACKLVESQIIHGYLDHHTFPPPFIPPNSTNILPFIIESSIYGAEVKLTYSCGEGKKVSFKSLQTYSFLGAGDISGQLISAEGINATYQVTPGTCWGGQPGIINWLLEN